MSPLLHFCMQAVEFQQAISKRTEMRLQMRRPLQGSRMYIVIRGRCDAQFSRSFWVEKLSTAVAGRGLNSTCIWRVYEGRREGILTAGEGLDQPKIEKVESQTENAPSQTHYLMKSWASTNMRYLILQITAKRRQCPPDAWSEGAIVSTILKNYTKMLPIAEDPIQVLVEIHVQVKHFSIYQPFSRNIIFLNWKDETEIILRVRWYKSRSRNTLNSLILKENDNSEKKNIPKYQG